MRSKWLAATAALFVGFTLPAVALASTDTTDPGATPASGSAASPAERPERIVSLSPTGTEILYALGAADQVVAVDSLSTYPAETADVLTDLSAFTPNLEAVAEYEPDLVLVSGQPDLEAQLGELDIAVFDVSAPTTFDEAYDQYRELGEVTGHADEAEALVAEMTAELDALAEQVPEFDTAPSVYHELSADGFSATSGTFIGQIYTLFGLENIADAAEGDHGGYPQLNSETIVAADPDLIFLADALCCGESPETVADRPGWDAIGAVADGQVYAMNDDIASRWGPRVVDYAATVLMALEHYHDGVPNDVNSVITLPESEVTTPDSVLTTVG